MKPEDIFMGFEVLSVEVVRQLAPDELMDRIVEVQRVIDHLAGYQHLLVAAAEERRAARSVGDITTADSLVRGTGMARSRARRVQRRARTIARHPQVADALAAGSINADQAEAIARAKIAPDTREALLVNAVGERTDTTRRQAAAAELAELDETPDERFLRQRSKRYLRFYDDREGMVRMQGALDPESGARLKATVTGIAGRMWRRDKHQPRSQRRTPEQREIDALCAAASQPPHHPGPGTATEPAGGPPRRPRHSTDGGSRTGCSDPDDNSRRYPDTPDGDPWRDLNGYRKPVVPVLRVSTTLQALQNELQQQGLHHAGTSDNGERLTASTFATPGL